LPRPIVNGKIEKKNF